MEHNRNRDDVIVLNRVFSGEYLEDNIGHEVINLFKSDNGKYYLYLNALGSFHKQWKNRIKSMLLVRTIKGAKMLEVIGLATGLSDVYDPELAEKTNDSKKPQPKLKADQDAFIDNNSISYGGVRINDIFCGNSFQQDVCISFEAERVVKPKEPIFITFERGASEEDISIGNATLVKLPGLNAAKASLKQYVENRGDSVAAYTALSSLINNKDMWGDDFKTVEESKAVLLPTATETMFDICRIAYSELAYSNTIAHFFEKYPHVFAGFMHEFGIDDFLSGKPLIIKRELYNIDLLFTNGDKTVIIENKIRSGINGLDKRDPKKSQLRKYYKLLDPTVTNYKSLGGKKDDIKELRRRFPNPKFFVLTPDYNNIDLEKYEYGTEYTKMHYSQLYNYLRKTSEYKNKADLRFCDFVNSLEKHSQPYDNELYVQTLKRFMDLINSRQSQNTDK